MPLSHLSHRSRFAGALATAALAGVTALGGTAAYADTTVTNQPAATLPTPPVPANLPAAIEPLQPYVPQDSCDPADKPGVQAFANLLMATYKDSGSYGISTACIPGDVSEHHEGRAFDWKMSASNPGQVAEVNALLDWLLKPDAAGNQAAMARRLGIMYIIWDRKILGTYRLSDGWRAYSGVDPHTSHVHFSFSWAGAQKRTSYWTGTVAPVDYGPCKVEGLSFAPQDDGTPNPTACPRVTTSFGPMPAGAPAYLAALRTWSGVILRQGSSGPAVTAVQQAIGTTADGAFGPGTASALQAWQTKKGIPASGVTDVATWRALLGQPAPAPSPAPAPTPAPSTPPAPAPGTASTPMTEPRRDWQRPRPAPYASRPVHSRPAPPPLTAPAPALPPYIAGGPAALQPYSTTTLQVGSSGAPVVALQKALQVTADGAFGPQTQGAVQKFQSAHRINPTGIVDAVTWRALMRAALLDPYRTMTLQVGSTGPAVSALQQVVGAQPVDGQFGPATKAAVLAYQQSRGLPATGVVGLREWLALGA